MTDYEWFNEPVEHFGKRQWMYNIVCRILRGRNRRLSYKELYLLLYGLNKNALGEEESKKRAMAKIIETYKREHNNNPPEGYDDGR